MADKRVPLRILEAVLTSTWAILPEALPPIIRIAAREGDDALEAVQAELGQQMDNSQRVEIRDRVAVIPISGPIFRKANLFTEMSGATSVEVLANDFSAAMDSPDVDSILLDVNSPGGQVDGVSEVAQMIYAARGTKPIHAHVDGFAASAAYWIASAADKMTASDTSLIGSIGVISTHDMPDGKSRTIEIVSSQSPLKSVDIMTPKGKARVQQMVDDTAGVFVGAAAKHRGVEGSEVLASFGKGDVLIASRALHAGMIDGVSTFEDVFARLAGKPSSVFRRAASAGLGMAADAGQGAFTTFLMRQLTTGQTGVWSDATGGHHTNIETLDITLAGRDAKVTPDDGDSVKLELKPEPAADVVDEEVVDMDEKEIAAAKAEAKAETLKAERERVAAINAVAGEYAHIITSAGELAVKAIQGGDSVEDYRATLQDNLPKADAFVVPGAESLKVGDDRELLADFPLGEMMIAVKNATIHPSAGVDKRLLNIQASATGLSEQVPSAGGFLLQPTVSSRWLERMYETGSIYSRVTRTPIGPGSNSLAINGIDETSRADGSRQGGVRGYWDDEADNVTASQPKFAQIELKLKGVNAAIYATNDELEDVVSLGARIERAAPAELNFKAEDAFFRGTGAGQPLGILSSPATVSVTKETNQDALTIKAENIEKMYALMPSSSMNTAVWHINQSCWPQLFQLHHAIGTGGVPMFTPAGGLSSAPFGTLLGRPILPIEYAATLGTVGDISFVDWSQYEVIEKGGIKSEASIHVEFLSRQKVFLFTMRIDGQPSWKSALTPYQAGTSETHSPYITLASRA